MELIFILSMNRGANIHAQDDLALIYDAYIGNTDTVELLLNRGANIHAGDDYALRSATKKGIQRL